MTQPGRASGQSSVDWPTSRHGVTGSPGAIRCPTLALVGREDLLLPLAFSEELLRLISGVELTFFEGGLLIELAAPVQTMLNLLAQHGGKCRLKNRPKIPFTDGKPRYRLHSRKFD
jgi:pimeloyl-ACP methyl ester carboxylesterase